MDSLQNAPQHSGPAKSRLGILTKTCMPSPVVNWILHARIRYATMNDVVFVGADYVEVKEVVQDGHLKHVARKSNFDAHIRAASVFSVSSEPLEYDVPIKDEKQSAAVENQPVPSQLLAITLDSNDLVFVYLHQLLDGTLEFRQQTCPLPTFHRILHQPGEHLAIDPFSRAIAVAASEREVIIYSAKGSEKLSGEIRNGSRDWCPVSSQRPLQIEGAIQQMDFLRVPAGDDDHVILLLIVIEGRMIKAVCIEWYYSSGLQHARILPPQPLDMASAVPRLFIPLRNAAFMLVNGHEITRFQGLLTGSVAGVTLRPLDAPPVNGGTSRRRPVWAAWCRPRRTAMANLDKDHLYLAREDGLVFSVQVELDGTLNSCCAGDLGCHVGRAFTSLGGARDPDILAAAGDMSSGVVVSMGHFSPRGRVSQLSWEDTMEMQLIETLPNWASVTDMVVSSLSQARVRPAWSNESIFVTSGKQPHGAVTRLRQGVEAQLSIFFEFGDLRSTTGVWALPVLGSGSLLLLLSSPNATRILTVPDCDFEQLTEPGAAERKALDTEHATLAAAALSDGRIIQVTSQCICITVGPTSNFEDAQTRKCKGGEAILAAAIAARLSIILTVERRQGIVFVCCFHASETDEGPGGNFSISDLQDGTSTRMNHDATAIGVVSVQSGVLAAISSTDAKLRFFWSKEGRMSKAGGDVSLSSDMSIVNLCESIVILQHTAGDGLLVLCGMRDGIIYALPVDASVPNQPVFGKCGNYSVGASPVRLAALNNDSKSAIAVCGADTCLVSWSGHGAETLLIEWLWVSDKLRPNLSQPHVAALNQFPPAENLVMDELGGNLIFVGAEEVMITTLDRSRRPVPRSIPVSGTPNRLLYAEQQRCLVVASLCTELVAEEPAHSRTEARRSIWPTIDFIPSRSDEPSFTYSLQPGDRVYALLEWSFKHVPEDKTYSFVLVGGSHRTSRGTHRGRLTFLRPSFSKSWDVVDVEEVRHETFDDPVHALARYDEVTYVACSGQHVHLQRFHVQERRWRRLCEPLRLASAGVFVTVSGDLITISTAEDSLVVLRLDESEDDGVFNLVPHSMAPRADPALSHLHVDIGSRDQSQHLTLMSSKYGRIVGLHTQTPEPGEPPAHALAADIVLEAQLPRSLTRIRRGHVQPPWRPTPPSGVLIGDIIGSATDGALVGIAVLDETLWRRLFWLQRLCEWSEELSPHLFDDPAYSADGNSYPRDERVVPAGLGEMERDNEIVLHARSERTLETHVDGDVLARVLEKGGAEKLREMLRQTAGKDDRVGSWMRKNLNREMAAVDEIIDLLRRLMDGWL